MVVVTVDDKYDYIERRLGQFKAKAPKVMCKSINDTAKWARRELAKEARKTYTVKQGRFYKNMAIKNARYSNLEATIQSEGAPMKLVEFKYSAGKKTTKAQVKLNGGLKALEKGGIKAFVNKISSKSQSGRGHTGIAQRIGPERLPIKELFSNSIPVMIGNEKEVYGIVEPEIEKKLMQYVESHIKKVLEGYE